MVKARQCTAYGCEENTVKRLPFCKECFKSLNSGLRHDLIAAYKVGGVRAIELSNQARDLFLKRKERPVSTGKSDIIDVSLEPRLIKGKAQAFFQGDFEDDGEKEIWIWLPLSQIEVSEKDASGCVEVSLPEWLAQKNELI